MKNINKETASAIKLKLKGYGGSENKNKRYQLIIIEHFGNNDFK